MGHRKGVYTGFYGPEELKKELIRRAEKEHRTLSQEVVHRLEESVKRDQKFEASWPKRGYLKAREEQLEAEGGMVRP